METSPVKIDWDSTKTEILLNPRLPKSSLDQIRQKQRDLPTLPAHFWLASSGTSERNVRLIALSKNAFLVSARAVNLHLVSNQRDRWLHALPDFHVGGLSISARAFLSGAEVFSFYDPAKKWNPHLFVETLERHSITLTSLVPTQLFDLISLGLNPPSSLRAILIGGGSCPAPMYIQARHLGWKILPSYGLSECCSQVATVNLACTEDKGENPPDLEILSHVEVRTNEEHLLAFKGKSLLTGYAYFDEEKVAFKDPKREGWFVSEDRGQVEGRFLRCFGRKNNVIKVGGELVDVDLLNRRFDSFLEGSPLFLRTILLPLEDPRLGHCIALLAEIKSSSDLLKPAKDFNRTGAPFERIRKVFSIEIIPRNSLGKIMLNEAKDYICRNLERGIDI